MFWSIGKNCFTFAFALHIGQSADFLYFGKVQQPLPTPFCVVYLTFRCKNTKFSFNAKQIIENFYSKEKKFICLTLYI